MRFLDVERQTLQKLLPGLDEQLASVPLRELERSGNPGIKMFRETGGPGLLVPTEHGGAGASALDAARAQVAIGARSPSLAVATTMHHFSMASLVVLSQISNGFEWMLMEGVARTQKLLASGFAEGRPDASILEPTMTAVAAPGGVRVSGVKKPCSLSRSMDLLTASAVVPRLDGDGDQMAVLLIPADGEGITVTPFWSSFVLAGAESDQVSIEDVFVPEELIVRTNVPPGQSLDALQIAGFVWFETLMAASYLGAASALVERVLQNDRISPVDRLRLVVELTGATTAIENICRQMPERQTDPGLLADCLLARYAVQDALARAVPKAVELLGGMSFISSDDVGYLAAAVNGLGFHPPSRSKMAGPLTEYVLGGQLTIA